MSDDFLIQLQAVLDQRRDQSNAETSYVAGLHQAGLNRILEKLGEECTEAILAAKDCAADGDIRALIHETADLWFHSMVLLSNLGTGAQAVIDELTRRCGLSGLDEKAQRAATVSDTDKEN